MGRMTKDFLNGLWFLYNTQLSWFDTSFNIISVLVKRSHISGLTFGGQCQYDRIFYEVESRPAALVSRNISSEMIISHETQVSSPKVIAIKEQNYSLNIHSFVSCLTLQSVPLTTHSNNGDVSGAVKKLKTSRWSSWDGATMDYKVMTNLLL